jgi:uncharacterized protein
MPESSTKRSGRQRPQDRGARDSRSAAETNGRTRFIVDAMLGSLARKLRAFGFDATYYKAGDDAGLLRLSLREGRIILTADRSLAARAGAKGIGTILLIGDSDRERLGSLAQWANATGVILVRGDPLCSLCGGELRAVKKNEISGGVPSSVKRRHRLFFQCESCRQIYWRGSHWKRLMSLARRLDQK